MGRGRQKMKAKFAGAFVGFRGLISLVLMASTLWEERSSASGSWYPS